MADKEHPTNSHGVFISSSIVKAHNRDDMRKLCFQTTNGQEFGHKTIDKHGRAENYDLIHSMGKKPSKYMRVPAKLARDFDRNNLTTFSEFDEKVRTSEMDNAMRELYTLRGNRPGDRTSGGMTFNTSYGEDFFRRSNQQMRMAKGENQGEKLKEATICFSPGGKDLCEMMVKTSTCHTEHKAQPRHDSFKTTMFAPSPNLTMSSFKTQMNSTYRAEMGLTRRNSAPADAFGTFAQAPEGQRRRRSVT